jgi:hypothetical protein
MPSEYVGTCGRARHSDREAVATELEFGIACVRRYCGPEPPGCSLEIVWHDHDSGAYPTISLVWAHGSLLPEHWNYIDRCGTVLDRLNDCIDWNALSAVARTDAAGTRAGPVARWIAPAFCGFCGGLWLTLIVSQPRLWWVPVAFLAPFVAWQAWESWDATKSLLTLSEYYDWVLGRGPRKTSRRNRLRAWWKHFTGARTHEE